MFKRKLILSVTGAALLAIPMTTSLPTAGWAQLSEIVVTTRRREENLQDVPLAVTAIGADAIQRQGVTGLQGITQISPSFIFNEAGAQKDVRITVRGLAPTRGRSNVAYLVDGIDVTSESIGTAGSSLMVSQRLLGDIQRVEAVKGPQSALYGRAAFAGAINYVTKDAPDEFEGQVGFEAADYGNYSVNGSVGGPVSDNFGLLVSAFYWDDQGQYSNIISGSDVGGGDGFGGAVTANWEVNDTLDFKARLEYTDEEFNPRPRARLALNNAFSASDLPAGVPDPIRAEFESDGPAPYLDNYGDADGLTITGSESALGGEHDGNAVDMFRASLIGNWDIDAISGTLRSYTGYIDSEANEDYDWDGLASGRPDTIGGKQWIFNDTKTEIFSQELRYRSDFDGPVQVTLGALYWDQEREFLEKGILGNGCELLPLFADSSDCQLGVSWQGVWDRQLSLGVNERQPFNIEDEHWSIYGMFEWDINDFFKATFEGRYVEEEQTTERALFNVTGSVSGEVQTAESCSLFSADDDDDFCRTFNTFNTVGLDPTFIGTEVLTFDRGTTIRSDTVKSSYFTPKATFEYTPNDDVLLYFSVGKGQKPGGINVLASATQIFDIDQNIFDSEKLWAYELGAKTEWSGGFGDLQLNGALFFQDYTDKQVSVRFIDVNGQPNNQTVNAGAAEVFGLEFNALWATPVDGLTITGGYTFLDSEFTQFDDVTDDGEDIARAGNCTPVDVDTNGDGMTDTVECRVSYAGNEIEQAPEHAWTLGASFVRPLANSEMDWFIEGDASYVDTRYLSQENAQQLDEYYLLNLRTGLETESWELVLFLDNATNDNTIRSGSQIPDFARTFFPAFGFNSIDTGILPQKRTVGLRGRFKF